MCPPRGFNFKVRADTWVSPYKKRLTGFTLLELMIVIAIISIVSMLTFPLYSQHLIHAKRLQAEVALIKLSNALEQYFLLHNTYEKATLPLLAISEHTADKSYQLQIISANNQDYLLTAIPLSPQAEKDASCAALHLDSNGTKSITGTGDFSQCWE